MLILLLNPATVYGVPKVFSEKFRFPKNTVTLFNTRKYSPVPNASSLFFDVNLTDENGDALDQRVFSSLELTIVNTDTGAVVNNVDGEDLLTSGRTFQIQNGSMSILLAPGDTTLAGSKRKGSHSVIVEWVYGPYGFSGRHQADFQIIKLAGD